MQNMIACMSVKNDAQKNPTEIVVMPIIKRMRWFTNLKSSGATNLKLPVIDKSGDRKSVV